MRQEIKNVISNIFPNQEIQQIKNAEQTIKKNLGKQFFKNNIKTIYWNKKNLIIQTLTIEAKTEVNLIKKQFIKSKNIIIK